MHHPLTCDTCHYYLLQASFIESHLEALDSEVLAEKVIPRGAGRPLSEQPPDVDITETEIDGAMELFSELMDTAYAYLLTAVPIGAKPTEGDPLYSDIDGEWEWYYEEYAYYETDTDEEIDEEEKDSLSLVFLDFYLTLLLSSTVDLIQQDMPIQRWVRQMRQNIRNSTVAEYLLGIGGKNVLDFFDVTQLKSLINAQFSYFQKFAEEIKNGELTGAAILQRVGMYGEAVTNGYEHAKAKSHAIVLPEYPADGNQICYTNCRCHWDLRDDPNDTDYVLATWRLNPTAEHCESCINNSRKWNPLRVKKIGA